MQPRSSAPRSHVPLIAALALVALFLAAIGVGQLVGLPWSLNLPGLRAGPLGHSIPTRISIPTIGVNAKVVQVGLDDTGAIATPKDNPIEDTGWYKAGPTPGQPGIAVIVGHVDTATRLAVFHDLDKLKAGDQVEVKREDNHVATFAVDSVETDPKTAFPANRVFAATSQQRLVLVTCGGAFDGGEAGYADNVIVFATLDPS